MNIAASRKAGYTDYAKDVARIRLEDSARPITAICQEIWDWCYMKGRLDHDSRDTFVESLRKAHSRLAHKIKAAEVDEDDLYVRHRNSALTAVEEELFIGFAQGMARLGLEMTPKRLRQLAHDMFPDHGKFSSHWYPISPCLAHLLLSFF